MNSEQARLIERALDKVERSTTGCLALERLTLVANKSNSQAYLSSQHLKNENAFICRHDMDLSRYPTDYV
jgi:hypothetical protein